MGSLAARIVLARCGSFTRRSRPHWPKPGPNEIAVFCLRKTRADGIPLPTTGGLLIHGDQLVVLLANAWRPTTTRRKLETASDTPLNPLGEVDFHFVSGLYQTTLAKHYLQKRIVMTSVPALSVDYRSWLAATLQSDRTSSPTQTESQIQSLRAMRERSW